ncbi:MAG: GGDEF domain-containing protein [Longimicrobiaceae bacterium]
MAMDDNLLRRALTDAETGLGNASYLRLELESTVERAERYRFPVSIITIRCTGEDVAGLARTVAARVRRSDCLARSAPEEISLVITHASRQEAEEVVERLRGVCKERAAAGSADLHTFRDDDYRLLLERAS